MGVEDFATKMMGRGHSFQEVAQMIAFAQQNVAPSAQFGAGPMQGVPQSQLPLQMYAATQTQVQPQGATATSSDTSMGLTAFVAGIDMTGISPLSIGSAAPAAPSAASAGRQMTVAASSSTPTATTSTTMTNLAASGLATASVATAGTTLTAEAQAALDQAAQLAKDAAGPTRVLAKYTSVIDLVDDTKNNEFISSGGKVMFIPIGDLNADAVQHMREVEHLPPDPTLQRMIDEAVAAARASAPLVERVRIPDPHQEFSHDLWKFICQQVQLKLYTQAEADDWWDENARWTTRLRREALMGQQSMAAFSQSNPFSTIPLPPVLPFPSAQSTQMPPPPPRSVADELEILQLREALRDAQDANRKRTAESSRLAATKRPKQTPVNAPADQGPQAISVLPTAMAVTSSTGAAPITSDRREGSQTGSEISNAATTPGGSAATPAASGSRTTQSTPTARGGKTDAVLRQIREGGPVSSRIRIPHAISA